MTTSSASADGVARSIQDRIRAMNDTLDAVEQKRTFDGSDRISTAEAVRRNNIRFENDNHLLQQQQENDEQNERVGAKKRINVIDIWRKREEAVINSIEKQPSVRKMSPIAHGSLNQTDKNASLNEVRTSLAHQFHNQHFQSLQPLQQPTSTNQRQQYPQHDASDLPDRSTTVTPPAARKVWEASGSTGGSRRTDAATPTPPHVPASGRQPQQSWTAPSFDKNEKQSQQQRYSNLDNDEKDLTIVESPSSLVEDTHNHQSQQHFPSRRSQRLADFWESTSRSENNITAPTTPLSMPTDGRIPTATTANAVSGATVSSQRRASVVDIWKTRTSSPSDTHKSTIVDVSPTSGTLPRLKSPLNQQSASPTTTNSNSNWNQQQHRQSLHEQWHNQNEQNEGRKPLSPKFEIETSSSATRKSTVNNSRWGALLQSASAHGEMDTAFHHCVASTPTASSSPETSPRLARATASTRSDFTVSSNITVRRQTLRLVRCGSPVDVNHRNDDSESSAGSQAGEYVQGIRRQLNHQSPRIPIEAVPSHEYAAVAIPPTTKSSWGARVRSFSSSLSAPAQVTAETDSPQLQPSASKSNLRWGSQLQSISADDGGDKVSVASSYADDAAASKSPGFTYNKPSPLMTDRWKPALASPFSHTDEVLSSRKLGTDRMNKAPEISPLAPKLKTALSSESLKSADRRHFSSTSAEKQSMVERGEPVPNSPCSSTELQTLSEKMSSSAKPKVANWYASSPRASPVSISVSPLAVNTSSSWSKKIAGSNFSDSGPDGSSEKLLPTARWKPSIASPVSSESPRRVGKLATDFWIQRSHGGLSASPTPSFASAATKTDVSNDEGILRYSRERSNSVASVGPSLTTSAPQNSSGCVTDRWNPTARRKTESPPPRSNGNRSPSPVAAISPLSNVSGRLDNYVNARESSPTKNQLPLASSLALSSETDTVLLLSLIAANSGAFVETTTPKGRRESDVSVSSVASKQKSTVKSSGPGCSTDEAKSLSVSDMHCSSIETNSMRESCSSIGSGRSMEWLAQPATAISGEREEVESEEFPRVVCTVVDNEGEGRCDDCDLNRDEKKEDDLSAAATITDRLPQAAARFSSSPTSLDKNISALVNEHVARTPSGKIRSKLSGQWKEPSSEKLGTYPLENETPRTAKNNAFTATTAPASILSNSSSTIGAKKCPSSTQKLNAGGTPPHLLPVDNNVAMLVKEHAARTPSGQKRCRSSHRWAETTQSSNSVFQQHDCDDQCVQENRHGELGALANSLGDGVELVPKSLTAATSTTVDDKEAENDQAVIRKSISSAHSDTAPESNDFLPESTVQRRKLTGSVVDRWNKRFSAASSDELVDASGILDLAATEEAPLVERKDSFHGRNGKRVACDDLSCTTSTERKESVESETSALKRENIADTWNKRIAASQVTDQVGPLTNTSGIYIDVNQSCDIRCSSLDKEASANAGIESGLTPPSDIIDAWTENMLSPKIDATASSPERTPVGNAQERCCFSAGKDVVTQRLSGHDAVTSNGEKSATVASPFEIIEEWSEQIRVSGEGTPADLNIQESVMPALQDSTTKKARAADSKAPVRVMRPLAFASWLKTEKAEVSAKLEESTSNERQDLRLPPSSVRKNLTMLGRKHLAHRVTAKTMEKANDQTAKSQHAAGKVLEPRNDDQQTDSQRKSRPALPSPFLAARGSGNSQSISRSERRIEPGANSPSPNPSRRYNSSLQISQNRHVSNNDTPQRLTYGGMIGSDDRVNNKRHGESILATSKDHGVGSHPRRSLFGAKGTRDRLSSVKGRDGKSFPVSEAPKNWKLKRLNPDSPEQVDDPSISDFDIALLPASNSSAPASSLANRAEKVLQDRRRKPFEKRTSPSESELEPPVELEDPDDCDLIFDELDDELEQMVPPSSDVKQVERTNRYRRTSRFLDPDEPDISRSIEHDDSTAQPHSVLESNDTQTIESMSHFSIETAKTDEKKQNATGNSRSKTQKQPSRQRHERKRHASPDFESESAVGISACKSVDSVKEVAAGFFAGSFDFGKLVSAVDEQFSALRDLVGVASEDEKLTKKRTLRIPKSNGLDAFDVEDVAIEVEYVDDGSQDGGNNYDQSFDSHFGADFDRQAMEYAQEATPSTGSSRLEERHHRSQHDRPHKSHYV